MTNTDTATRADPNDWTWWQNALKGEFGPVHDGDPQTGYYRVRRRGRDSDSPCAFWFDKKTGELRCHLDGEDFDLQRAREIWNYACKKPVTAEVYGERIRSKIWPSESEAVTRSNNAPEDNSFDGYSAMVEDLVREAEKIIAKGAAATQDEADRAADLSDRLSKLGKHGNEIRGADPDVTPELREASNRVAVLNQRWFPVIEMTAIYKQIKAVVLTPFLNKKATAEANARVAAAKSGAPLPETARPAAKAGTRGKAVSLRTVKTVTIEDRAAVLAFFADGTAMTEFLQTLAEKAVRASITVPGVKITESKVAA